MSQNLNEENFIKHNQENFSYWNIFKKVYDYFENWLEKQEKKMALKRSMEESNSYEEWSQSAKELDIVEGKEVWKLEKESNEYDFKEVEKLIKVIRKKKEIKDISGLVHYIRANLVKNLYSTLNPRLYQVCHHGTKYFLEDFQDEMIKSLEYISNYNEKIFPLNRKLEFFSETRHSYGRTALLLSGGASLGIYHIGVIKTLYQQNLLPRIICGSSAGSIVASILCTTPYEKVIDNIEIDFKNRGLFQYKEKNSTFLRILKYIASGVIYDSEVLKECLRDEIGDVTFQEAFDKTGWILNITVTGYKEHANHKVLNYLTAPNVLIWSASCASSSVPGIFDPSELLCKNEYGHIVPYSSNRVKYVDGSLSADLPMQRISELFNVNIFMVSQTNPHVIPFLEQEDNYQVFHSALSFNFFKLIKTLIFSEIKHRFVQIQTLGILPNFITKWLNFFTQECKGHVTIFPVPNIIDYFSILGNPNKEKLAYARTHACRRTFPRILSFELALEKHHKRLKLRLNSKNNLLNDKRYLMELQEAFDDYNTNLLLKNARLYNMEEKKMLNFNFQDLISNTEQNTNSSNYDLFENIDVLNKHIIKENSSSEDEDILEKYNQIIFYNQENEINLNDNPHDKNKSNFEDFNTTIVCLKENKKNKNKKNYKQSQIKQRMRNVFIDRHNSFILPRIGSK